LERISVVVVVVVVVVLAVLALDLEKFLVKCCSPRRRSIPSFSRAGTLRVLRGGTTTLSLEFSPWAVVASSWEYLTRVKVPRPRNGRCSNLMFWEKALREFLSS
jgi:hypothetical protein